MVAVFYIHLLQSEEKTDQRDVGFASDLKARLKIYNCGGSADTAEPKPSKLVGYHRLRMSAERANSNTISSPVRVALSPTSACGE
jgi:hypothetical protein